MRTPKLGVHSAPEYVVGTETTRQPGRRRGGLRGVDRRAAADREQRVGAGRHLDPVGRNLRPRGHDAGTSTPIQRGLATRNGRSIPSSASTSGSSASDQRTITASRLAGELDERPGRARLGPAGRAHEIDLALELEPLDARLGERARREVGLDRRARDERHAVARRGRRSTPTPAARARAARRGRGAGCPTRCSSSSISCRTPAPSCITIRSAPRSSSSVTVLPANRWPGGQARIDLVTEERLEDDAAVPARGADDPELELARRNPLDDRLRVEDPQHARAAPGGAPWNSQSSCDSTIPPGPGRGADLERAVELLARLLGHLGDDLLLEREQPLRAAVEPHSRLGRLDPPARAVEELRPEPLLERADLQAHRRLGDAEPLGGLREAAPLDDRAKCRKLTRVHKDSLYGVYSGGGAELEPVPERVVRRRVGRRLRSSRRPRPGDPRRGEPCANRIEV